MQRVSINSTKTVVSDTKKVVSAPKKKVSANVDEKWLDSSIYPEIMVSSNGRIKSKSYRLVTKDANKDCFRIYDVPAKILETRISSGEVSVLITKSNGVQVTASVALLVAKEFAPNEDPARYTKVKYRDHNSENVKASNLYWDGVGPWAK